MKRFAIFFMFTGVFCFFSNKLASAQNAQLQAVFIYNFTKNIDWPPSNSNTGFIIGVLGDSDIIDELHSISKKYKIDNQPIIIKQFSSIDKLSKCNILFVPGAESNNLATILSKLQNQSTLLIVDQAEAAKQGADINFTMHGGKLGFEINPNNLEKRDLKVSSKLLELGDEVE